MEHLDDSSEILEHLTCPAFLVNNAMIVNVNQAAAQLQISAGDPIEAVIGIGADDYANYTEGKLYLTLLIDGISYDACVTVINGKHLFCLKSDYQAAELRAFALAAQYLRGPLANAIASTEQLLQLDCVQDGDSGNLTAQINHSLHQIFRAIGNMSDVSQLQASRNNLHAQDAVWVFEELLQKAASLVEQSGRKLEYSIPRISTSCMMDPEQLERAVYNLISNAVKYSDPGSSINAAVQYRSSRLYFTIENDLCETDQKISQQIFARYLREPGIEDGRAGIGLGMSIVQSVAFKHGGTVLLECPEQNRMRITMSIQLKTPAKDTLNSPIRMPIDYTGGFDHALIELSDILPPTAYNGKF